MTVLGGLQLPLRVSIRAQFSSFNTDDGIRRAAMWSMISSRRGGISFNTDDGIRRAAILCPWALGVTGPRWVKWKTSAIFRIFGCPRQVLCSAYRRVRWLKALPHKGWRCSVKNRKTCGLFDPQKGFLLFAVYHLGKILSTSVKMDQ